MLPNPETVKLIFEIADVIHQMDEFEKLHNQPAAIVERQNLSLGVSYDIAPEEKARAELQKWHGREIYLRMWPKQYFLDLQSRYKG